MAASAPIPSLIACVALVGRTNGPLYIKSFGGEDLGKLQLAVYTSLDMIEEKVNERRIPGQRTLTTDPFLGLLYPVEDYKVFGYITNTNTKIIIVVRDVLLREDKVRELFKSVHRLYADAVANPFAPLDAKITSPRFEEQIYRLVEASNSTIEYRGPMPF